METISLICFLVQLSLHNPQPSNNRPHSASWTSNSHNNSSNSQTWCSNRTISLEVCRLTVDSNRLNLKHNKMLLDLSTSSQHSSSSLSNKCHSNSQQMHSVSWTRLRLLLSNNRQHSHLTYSVAWTWAVFSLSNNSNLLETCLTVWTRVACSSSHRLHQLSPRRLSIIQQAKSQPYGTHQTASSSTSLPPPSRIPSRKPQSNRYNRTSSVQIQTHQESSVETARIHLAAHFSNNRYHSSKLTNSSQIGAASNPACPTWWWTSRWTPCNNSNSSSSNRCKCREWWWCNNSNSSNRWTQWAKWTWCQTQEWDKITWWDKEAWEWTQWQVKWAWTIWELAWAKCSSPTPCSTSRCKVACKEAWAWTQWWINNNKIWWDSSRTNNKTIPSEASSETIFVYYPKSE